MARVNLFTFCRVVPGGRLDDFEKLDERCGSRGLLPCFPGRCLLWLWRASRVQSSSATSPCLQQEWLERGFSGWLTEHAHGVHAARAGAHAERTTSVDPPYDASSRAQLRCCNPPGASSRSRACWVCSVPALTNTDEPPDDINSRLVRARESSKSLCVGCHPAGWTACRSELVPSGRHAALPDP